MLVTKKQLLQMLGRKRGRGRPKKYAKYKQPYGAPLMRPVFTRSMRVKQNLTRDVRWFKEVRTIQSNLNGNFRQVYLPTDVNNCLDFIKWARIFEEFKVLKVRVVWHPAAVGSESLQEGTSPPPTPGPEATFKRGNSITWCDQGDPDLPVGVDTIAKLIVKPSAKLINPRYKHTRYVCRPFGNPEWGRLDDDGTISSPDSWTDTRISIFGEGFTPILVQGDQTWFYVTISYLVMLRGRQADI